MALSVTLPTPGDPGSSDTWGATLNTAINAIVSAINNTSALVTTAATSSTTDTALFVSPSIPANSLAIGEALKIRVAGISSSTGTLTFKVHLGTAGTVSDATVATSVTTAAQGANQWADVECLVVIRTTGSGGTCIGSFSGTALAAGISNTTAAPATTTVNTTVGNFITISCACSTGTFTAQLATLELNI